MLRLQLWQQPTSWVAARLSRDCEWLSLWLWCPRACMLGLCSAAWTVPTCKINLPAMSASHIHGHAMGDCVPQYAVPLCIIA